MSPDEYCQRKAAQSGTSFYYATRFLPSGPPQRAVTALEAFCREVEAIVDDTNEASVARMKLAWWRDQVAAIFDGKPDHPVAVVLSEHVDACGLKPAPLYAVIEASEMNLDQFRYDDWAGLREYCWRARGLIGGLAAGALGHTRPQTLEYGETLGLALQMTRIIADVGDDARRGRIYLPGDEMTAHNVTVDDILDGRYADGFPALLLQQAQRTRALFCQALQALPQADRRAQRLGLMLTAMHWALLDEIERDGWHVLHQRIALTPIRKFWLAWRTWVGGGRALVRRLSNPS